MSPKQAMNLDTSVATKEELRKAESILFKAKFRAVPSSPMQRELSDKYWEVRRAMGWKPKANPSAKPSLIGDITESFVPLDLMERTAEGAFSDVSRLSHTARGRKRRNPPDAVVHVVRAGRGKYVVRGIEVANCGSHCPALPNPNVIFKSLAKVKTWAKGLFKGDRHNRKVELVLQD